MKRFINALVITLSLLSGSLLVPAAAAYAASPTDAAKSQVCTGISGTGGTCGTGGAAITHVVRGALNVVAVIAGVAAVFMVIISGMKYITSQGDAQAVASAKRTLIYAIVGLVVVAMSQLLVHFVLSKTK